MNKHHNDHHQHHRLAANAIRGKIQSIHAKEPDALQELAESESISRLSKHQRFIHDLRQSGQDLATIQTAWHNYYLSLPEEEKQAVWDEFYASQNLVKQTTVAHHKQQAGKRPKTFSDKVKHKVSAGGKLKAKHHLQSLLFGLGVGLVAMLILLFGFFNEVFIAPFIQPSRSNSSVPLIVSSDSVTASSQPEVIIPKINVQIPVNYGVNSTSEALIENSLESGVVHYPTTATPGQNGNAVFFGHSSNNIFNKGKYKFAFVLLRSLSVDDTFYLTYNGKVYVYKVISKKVVEPSEVGVLGNVEGQTATATLITCDPPGTSLKRLVVVGTQVSPDVASNSASDVAKVGTDTYADQIPGNGPTLFNNLISTTTGKLILASIMVLFLIIGIRWLYKPRK